MEQNPQDIFNVQDQNRDLRAMVQTLSIEKQYLTAQNVRLKREAAAKSLSRKKNCTLQNRVTGLKGVVEELITYFKKTIDFYDDVPIAFPKTKLYMKRTAE